MGDASGVSRTFIIEHMVIHGGGHSAAEELVVDAASPIAVAAPGEPSSPAMTSAGKQTAPAATHMLPPQSLVAVGQGTPPATPVKALVWFW